MLLPAASTTALRAVQERAGIVPSRAAACGRAGQGTKHVGRGDTKTHQPAGLLPPETVSGKERNESLLYCCVGMCAAQAYKVFIESSLSFPAQDVSLEK